MFLLATAVLAVSLKVFFIAKYSFYPLVSLVVYFVTILLINDMGQIRYGLAMSLMLLFFHEIVRSHIKKAFFFFFLAVLFHYSALIALPALLLRRHVFTRKQVLFLFCVFFSFYIFSINDLLQWSMAYIPVPHIQSKIQFYTAYTDTYGKSLGLNISFLLRSIILFMLFGCKSNAKVDFYTWNFLFNMYFCGVLIYMMFNSNSEFATRGSGYFKILELVILPLFIYVSRGLRNKLLIWFFIMMYCLYSLSKILFDTEFGGPYLPYSNVLFD